MRRHHLSHQRISHHHSANSQSKPLSEVERDQKVRLVKVDAGHRATHRLAEMGLTPGTDFKVLQNYGGPLLISVRGSRLAIGRGLAEKIWVALN